MNFLISAECRRFILKTGGVILILAISSVFPATASTPCTGGFTDVMSSYDEKSDLYKDVDERWRKNCPGFLCGPKKKKSVAFQSICMKKTKTPNVLNVEAKFKAVAAFRLLVPLKNVQVVTIRGIADFNGCEFTLGDNLKFDQKTASMLARFFVKKGDRLSLEDEKRNNECKHYMPVF